jgi:DNA-binding XRE family transcriptional regulator
MTELHNQIIERDLASMSIVAKFFDSEDKWCKGNLAQRKSRDGDYDFENREYTSTGPCDVNAVKFCLLGAAMSVESESNYAYLEATPTGAMLHRVYDFAMSIKDGCPFFSHIKGRMRHLDECYGSGVYAVASYNDFHGYEGMKELVDAYLLFLLKTKWYRQLDNGGIENKKLGKSRPKDVTAYNVLSTRLKQLRMEYNGSPSAFAVNEAGVRPDTILRIERLSHRIPTIKLLEIAYNLNISPVSLLTVDDSMWNRFSPQTPKAMASIIAMKFRIARSRSGYSHKQLALATGMNINTLYRYECGKTLPSLDKLELLSITLGVPLTYFFEPVR